MNTKAAARGGRGPLRCTALAVVTAISGTGLLLAGCSGSSASRSATADGQKASNGSSSSAAALPGAPGGGQVTSSQVARLVPASQSIIYTASLTVRVANVRTAVTRATTMVTDAGGYSASEQESARPGHAPASASLQLKVPVAAYPATLQRLSADLGRETSLSQHASDVTARVADVASRVGSARDAITQLRALLRRAGSVSGLLSVQDQINAQESSLEALQAQQRALTREVSYATVSVLLVSQHRKSVKSRKPARGFAAGLGSGWHGLLAVTSWLLTALGVVLPFAIVLALAGGAGYWARRRLRRGSRASTAG
jgi:Domain of unknown function (DUF4349)